MTETRHGDQEQQKMTYQDAKNTITGRKNPKYPKDTAFLQEKSLFTMFLLDIGSQYSRMSLSA